MACPKINAVAITENGDPSKARMAATMKGGSGGITRLCSTALRALSAAYVSWLHSHLARRPDAENRETIAQHMRGSSDKRQTCLLDTLVVDKNSLGVVVAVVTSGQLA